LYLYLKIFLIKMKHKIVNRQEYLDFGKFYHIYNKAIGKELLFKTEYDYFFFLKKIDRFILPVAKIISYCLIPNHFHLLIYTRDEDEIKKNLRKKSFDSNRNPIIQSFSNFFNSYSKSYNKIQNRMGRLFVYPFKKILVDKDDYLISLICYIHRNPIHHGMVNDFSKWKYSSYNAFITNKPTKVEREFVIGLFGSLNDFIVFHNENKIKPGIDSYIFE